jgi:hypothetical protein
MPCWTTIKTTLIVLATIEEAAKALGITMEKRTANSYTLRKGREYVTIEREAADLPFNIRALSGSNNWEADILQPLTVKYTETSVKNFYRSQGYTVSAGQKPGELIFTKYS